VDHPYWPLFDLRIRTPRLEVRLPDDDDIMVLAGLAGDIHDPATMPFTSPFTDAPSPQRERSSLQWWWRQRAEWSPERWWFTGAVVVDGELVGVQDLHAEQFAALRTVSTGSWLGRSHQRQGIGKEMRAAVLHLAFAGLGAVEAYSGAFHDNLASLATSRALGYRLNGEEVALRRNVPDRIVNLRLDRATWEARRRSDIRIEGLEPCLELFGLGDEPQGHGLESEPQGHGLGASEPPH
jgi:RimJ/RimL family protein N-acetyltransferase